jgi:hypothetical protein
MVNIHKVFRRHLGEVVLWDSHPRTGNVATLVIESRAIPPGDSTLISNALADKRLGIASLAYLRLVKFRFLCDRQAQLAAIQGFVRCRAAWLFLSRSIAYHL